MQLFEEIYEKVN